MPHIEHFGTASRWAFAASSRTPPAAPRGKRPPTRRGALGGRRVLFLDFDGVLHPAPAKNAGPSSRFIAVGHFGWLPALVQLLRPHPDVSVVVHSSWREAYNDDELGEMLSDLGDRVLGGTPPGERYESVLRWLDARPEFTSYRILDDDPAEFPAPPPGELIVCDPIEGVADATVLAALRLWLES